MFVDIIRVNIRADTNLIILTDRSVGGDSPYPLPGGRPDIVQPHLLSAAMLMWRVWATETS